MGKLYSMNHNRSRDERGRFAREAQLGEPSPEHRSAAAQDALPYLSHMAEKTLSHLKTKIPEDVLAGDEAALARELGKLYDTPEINAVRESLVDDEPLSEAIIRLSREGHEMESILQGIVVGRPDTNFGLAK